MKLLEWLINCGFNEEQAEFIVQQKKNYLEFITRTETEICKCCGHTKEVNYFNNDNYEREMWFVMNRSGLFEYDDDTDEDKGLGKENWTVCDTRSYITENNLEV